jgi:hypothetical protein
MGSILLGESSIVFGVSVVLSQVGGTLVVDQHGAGALVFSFDGSD